MSTAGRAAMQCQAGDLAAPSVAERRGLRTVAQQRSESVTRSGIKRDVLRMKLTKPKTEFR